MPSSTSRHAWHDPRRTVALWIGLFAGPVLWFTVLEANYVLSYVACESRQKWFLHAVTLVAVAAVGAAGLLSWRSGPAENSEHPAPPVTHATSESRARWMSIAGVVLSLWFMLVILAMEIPILVLRACEAR